MHSIALINIATNQIGDNGAIAIGNALKENKTLTVLTLRIFYNAHYNTNYNRDKSNRR
jgi:hypothetical protein